MRVRAGTLDNPELIAPTAIIWADSAPCWATFDPNLPRVSERTAGSVSARRSVRFPPVSDISACARFRPIAAVTQFIQNSSGLAQKAREARAS